MCVRVGSSSNNPHAVLVPIEPGDGAREVVEPSLRLSAASLICKIADPNTVWEAISGHRLCPLGHE